jgi:hypothetical protein
MVNDKHGELPYCVKTDIFGGFFRTQCSNRVMGDNESTETAEDDRSEKTESSFRERVREIQEQHPNHERTKERCPERNGWRR